MIETVVARCRYLLRAMAENEILRVTETDVHSRARNGSAHGPREEQVYAADSLGELLGKDGCTEIQKFSLQNNDDNNYNKSRFLLV